MPIALNPDLRFKIYLDSDAEIPESKRPAFICKHMTGRLWQKYAEVSDSIQAAESGTIALDRVVDALLISVVGWENMGGHKFSRDKMLEVLLPAEIKELVNKVMLASNAPGEALGKSESRPASKPGRSAKSV